MLIQQALSDDKFPLTVYGNSEEIRHHFQFRDLSTIIS